MPVLFLTAWTCCRASGMPCLLGASSARPYASYVGTSRAGHTAFFLADHYDLVLEAPLHSTLHTWCPSFSAEGEEEHTYTTPSPGSNSGRPQADNGDEGTATLAEPLYATTPRHAFILARTKAAETPLTGQAGQAGNLTPGWALLHLPAHASIC